MYLQIGDCLIHPRIQEFSNFRRFVSNVLNANHKSTGIEGKNVPGKDYIKLYLLAVPLKTYFLALALVNKSESTIHQNSLTG